jgi:hypothetical protein
MLKNGNDFTAADCAATYPHSPGAQAVPYRVIAVKIFQPSVLWERLIHPKPFAPKSPHYEDEHGYHDRAAPQPDSNY